MAVDSILANGCYSAQIRTRENNAGESFICLRHVRVAEATGKETIAVDAAKDALKEASCNSSLDKATLTAFKKAPVGNKLNLDLDCPDCTNLSIVPLANSGTGPAQSQLQEPLAMTEPLQKVIQSSREFLMAMLDRALHKISCTRSLDKATVTSYRKEFSGIRDHNQDSAQCPVCTKMFVHRRAMLEHALKKASCTSSLNEATVTAFRKEFSEKHRMLNSTQCPVCTKTFVNRRAMLEHALNKASCTSSLDKATVTAFNKEFSTGSKLNQDSDCPDCTNLSSVTRAHRGMR
jgi:ribosomal protein L37AE/L43A